MILSLTRYTARLALRIRNTLDFAQTNDWQNLQLLITRPIPKRPCHTCGSPWILHGCWPFHPTDVDLANPQMPDFPTIAIDAFDADEEGRIVFILDDRVHSLPNGRYIGTIRIRQRPHPINIPVVRQQQIPFGQLGSESTYTEDKHVVPCTLPPPVQIIPKEPICNLFTFDIELGPECAQHMVDQIVGNITRSTVADDIEFCASCEL